MKNIIIPIDKKGEAFLDMIRTTKEVLIITVTPLDLYQSELGKRFIRLMLEKVGIIRSIDRRLIPACFTFYFADTSPYLADRFWAKLYRYILNLSGADFRMEDKVSKKLAKINLQNKINTYLIPGENAWFPVVFTEFNDAACINGYCLSYKHGLQVSAVQLSTTVSCTWKDVIYPNLNQVKIPITFQSRE